MPALNVPAPAASSEDQDTYALVPDDPVEHATASCPACGKVMPPGAVLCVSCGYDSRKGFQLGTGVGATETKGGATTCPHCGYSLKGLKARRCPECGKVPYKSKKDEYREESRRTVRTAYLTPIIATLIALPMLALLAWWLEGGAAVLTALITWAVSVPVGLLLYLFVCLVWAGFDAPIHLSTLRLTAVFAIFGCIGLLLSQVPMPIPGFGLFIQLLIFVGLICVFMDLEMHEAALMAVLLYALWFGVSLAIIALMM